jgi:16S rRNA processing protein RimM
MSLPSSSLPGEPAYLAVGKLHRPHGVHGEMVMEVLTDFPERLRIGMTLYVGAEHVPLQLKKVRGQNRGMLVSFEGYPTPEEAGKLRNQFVYVLLENSPKLPEGEYYHHQIIGLEVVTQQGEALGKIIEILETGANDVFVIRPNNGSEILVPNTDEAILSIDLEKNQMVIHLLPGLLPDEKI